jgi:glucose-6-phosphate-specific signal transduction histidine kinase
MNGKKHLQHEAWVGGISNAFFNGIIAWLLLRSSPPLTWGGEHSFAVDVIATALLLPLIVALIVIPLQRSKLRKGKLQSFALPTGSTIQAIADRFPGGTGKSALLFGLTGMLVVAPVTLLVLFALGVDEFAPMNYAIFKGIWAGLMAAILVVPMVLVALRPLPQTNHSG